MLFHFSLLLGILLFDYFNFFHQKGPKRLMKAGIANSEDAQKYHVSSLRRVVPGMMERIALYSQAIEKGLESV